MIQSKNHSIIMLVKFPFSKESCSSRRLWKVPLSSVAIKCMDRPRKLHLLHYYDVIMGAIASQITSLTIVYSSVYSGADQSKHQSSASLAFVSPVNSPHKWPVTRKMFPFDDVIMCHPKYIVTLGNPNHTLFKYVCFDSVWVWANSCANTLCQNGIVVTCVVNSHVYTISQLSIHINIFVLLILGYPSSAIFQFHITSDCNDQVITNANTVSVLLYNATNKSQNIIQQPTILALAKGIMRCHDSTDTKNQAAHLEWQKRRSNSVKGGDDGAP